MRCTLDFRCLIALAWSAAAFIPSVARALDCGLPAAPELSLICTDDLLRPQHEAFSALQRAAVQAELSATFASEPRDLRELIANRGVDREVIVDLYDREIWALTRKLAKLAPQWPGGIYSAVTAHARIEVLIVPIDSWPPYVDLRVRAFGRGAEAGTRVTGLFADRHVALGYETADCELTLGREQMRPEVIVLQRFGACKKSGKTARFDRAARIPAQIELQLAHD